MKSLQARQPVWDIALLIGFVLGIGFSALVYFFTAPVDEPQFTDAPCQTVIIDHGRLRR